MVDIKLLSTFGLDLDIGTGVGPQLQACILYKAGLRICQYVAWQYLADKHELAY